MSKVPQIDFLKPMASITRPNARLFGYILLILLGFAVPSSFGLAGTGYAENS
jgi:hypothetical protein